MLGQMAPMGAGLFEVALDIGMLKDAIVDHRLPVQSMLAAQVDGGVTPGQMAMTQYDSNTPGWDQHVFKADSAAFSPLAVKIRSISRSGVTARAPEPEACHLADRATVQARRMYTHPHRPMFLSRRLQVRHLRSVHRRMLHPPSTIVGDEVDQCLPLTRPLQLNLTSPGTSPRYSPTSPSFSPTSPRYSRRLSIPRIHWLSMNRS
jgi:DNA-directed RNA polymerase II subunit RPB1